MSAGNISQLVQLLDDELVNLLIVQQVIDNDQDFILRMGHFPTFVKFEELILET